jgi:hypothetical protein
MSKKRDENSEERSLINKRELVIISGGSSTGVNPLLTAKKVTYCKHHSKYGMCTRLTQELIV